MVLELGDDLTGRSGTQPVVAAGSGVTSHNQSVGDRDQLSA